MYRLHSVEKQFFTILLTLLRVHFDRLVRTSRNESRSGLIESRRKDSLFVSDTSQSLYDDLQPLRPANQVEGYL